MNHDEILRQIPDYVLGLLSSSQLGAVEHHVSRCTTCQHALIRERKIGRLVQSTVDVATTPNNARVRALMPAVPRKRRLLPVLNGWQKQLAPAVLLLLLLIGGFTLNSMLPAGSMPTLVATAHAATATGTYTPTATIVQSHPEYDKMNHLPKEDYSNAIDTAVLIPAPSLDTPVQTPDPLPTPVAAIRQVTAQ